jgi:neuroligin
MYLSKANKNTFMYVFNHNSEAGDHAGIDKSIHGEDLPYIFGAPLGGISPSPFHSTYNSEEQLLSKAIMKYFTHFAHTGRPTDIQRSLYSSRSRHRVPI